KELIAEAMYNGGLDKGDVVEKDYIQEIIDHQVETEEGDAEETED
ncbi:MAG: hypothetical protein HUJ61_02670, partial [Bacilli bacterium]|nr:hypothetical protein [Bacilli bacterium]